MQVDLREQKAAVCNLFEQRVADHLREDQADHHVGVAHPFRVQCDRAVGQQAEDQMHDLRHGPEAKRVDDAHRDMQRDQADVVGAQPPTLQNHPTDEQADEHHIDQQ
ncbi:hypothetical protein [Candidatus Flexifilum breve]|uniref:hypothetical protein n=1 Tax=Candidatus Flexifilum breve TaxID=3140694 RepID=UPI0031CCB311